MTATRRILAAIAAAAAVVAAGSGANLAALAILEARHPVPGAFYTVDGRAMHIYCSGIGLPTVVLEGGLGDDWLYWQKVQPEVARTTRVCSYDRAGLGWSDPRSDVRDAWHIAAQLHQLLQQAGEAAPLVLVGASAGGFYVRQFTAMYPDRAAAIVFVDSSVPEQIHAIPGREYSPAVARQKHRDAMWDWLRQASGWARVSGRCNGEVENGLDAYKPYARAAACRPSFAASWLGEWDEFWRSADEAAAAPCCREQLVVVVSQDPDRPKPGWRPEDIAAQHIWNRLQENLTALSPRSRRIIARNSGHHVMIDRPDVVIGAIRDVVSDVRTMASSPRSSPGVQ